MADNMNIQGLEGGKLNPLEAHKSRVKNPNAPDFEETLKGFLTDVNKMQKNADTSIQKMIAGEVKDVHQVMLAVGEAKVAFNMMLEIRNKTMEAYQELIKMRG